MTSGMAKHPFLTEIAFTGENYKNKPTATTTFKTPEYFTKDINKSKKKEILLNVGKHIMSGNLSHYTLQT